MASQYEPTISRDDEQTLSNGYWKNFGRRTATDEHSSTYIQLSDAEIELLQKAASRPGAVRLAYPDME